MSRSHGGKICGSQQTLNLQIRQKKTCVLCPVWFHSGAKTAVHTFLPSFGNRNGRLCQERLLRSRNLSTMAMWRHTSSLHMELKQPQRLRQGERSRQIVFVPPFQTLRRAICPMLHPQVLHPSSVKKVKLVVVCLYKTFHWHDWRFNRAVACSADEFCSASDDINAGSPSWMLRLTEGWASQKVILKERTTG